MRIRRGGAVLFNGNAIGDVVTWDGTAWRSAPIPPNSPSSTASPGDTIIYVFNGTTLVAVPTSYGIWGNKWAAMVEQAGFNATLSFVGCNPTGFGTIAAGAFATTSYGASVAHANYSTTAAANVDAGIRMPTGNTRVWRGDAVGRGGFLFRVMFTPVAFQAGSKGFIGMRNDAGSNPLGVSVPSALLNTFGIGWDAGDTDLFWMHNDGAGAATKTSTGITLASLTGAVTYDLEIVCDPNASTMAATLYSVDASGRTVLIQFSASTNIPVNTAFLDPLWDVNSAASGVISSMRFHRMFLEAR